MPSINYGLGLIVVDRTWANFATVVTAKRLLVQFEESSDRYEIFSVDASIVYRTTIYTGTVPDGTTDADGDVLTQGTNDANKTDFETNYEPTANTRTLLDVKSFARATYSAEVALAGANNKDMISIFNPAGSGKIIKVRKAWAVVPNSSGATVIIPFELRSATAITTGTTVVAKPLDSTNPAAVAVARQAPTGITDATDPLWWTWIEQINTAQGGTENMSHTMHNSSAVADVQPITLRPGEGLYLEQKASNTSTFRMGFLWTEE